MLTSSKPIFSLCFWMIYCNDPFLIFVFFSLLYQPLAYILSQYHFSSRQSLISSSSYSTRLCQLVFHLLIFHLWLKLSESHCWYRIESFWLSGNSKSLESHLVYLSVEHQESSSQTDYKHCASLQTWSKSYFFLFSSTNLVMYPYGNMSLLLLAASWIPSQYVSINVFLICNSFFSCSSSYSLWHRCWSSHLHCTFQLN